MSTVSVLSRPSPERNPNSPVVSKVLFETRLHKRSNSSPTSENFKRLRLDNRKLETEFNKMNFNSRSLTFPSSTSHSPTPRKRNRENCTDILKFKILAYLNINFFVNFCGYESPSKFKSMGKINFGGQNIYENLPEPGSENISRPINTEATLKEKFEQKFNYFKRLRQLPSQNGSDKTKNINVEDALSEKNIKKS